MTPLTIADLAAAYAAARTPRFDAGTHEAGLSAVVALVAARVRAESRVGYDADEQDEAVEEALRAALGDLAGL